MGVRRPSQEEVARRSGVDSDSVRAWRRRFEEKGVAGVGVIAKGRGRRSWLPDGTVAEIVRVTQQELPPDGATHWSTCALAERLGVGKDTVARTWRNHELKPWKVDRFKNLYRPPLRRQAGRRRWALPGPAQAGGRFQLRRENPGPGPRPYPTLPAATPGPGGHHDP